MFPRFGVAEGEVAGITCLAARTGYTGEDGFELFVGQRWRAACSRRFSTPALPRISSRVGLGARDTLRLEAGLPLYGHELDRDTSPLEAGLATFVKFGRDFVGERGACRATPAGSEEEIDRIADRRRQNGRAPGLPRISQRRRGGRRDQRDVRAVDSAADRDGISEQRGRRRRDASKSKFAIAKRARRRAAAILPARRGACGINCERVIECRN